jgi:hypothetical protein
MPSHFPAFATDHWQWPETVAALRSEKLAFAQSMRRAISEQLRANALRGLPTSPDDLVRIERLSAHALRTLRLPSSVNKQTVTLTDYLASTAAE